MQDFTPTAEQISLHGLGFIQVKLPANARLHVWHPDLPRRSCYEHSAIHNHRFGFFSRVLVGTQINRLWGVWENDSNPTHDVISHDGPRSPSGGRESYVAGQARAAVHGTYAYTAGQSYTMPALAYHDTPNEGVVVTLMQKKAEGTVHAASLIEIGHTFDQGFDRFQLSADELWDIVLGALKGAA